MEIVFFGSPAAAVESLRALISSKHHVVAVVTSPDRKAGRGMHERRTAVKEAALAQGLEVYQPQTLRDPEVVRSLASFRADIFVVVAYGLILPSEVLNTPPKGCLNVHFSLLPRLRGAAPVQWALIEGHEVTGVSVIQMDEGVDTGPILAIREVPVDALDDSGTLGSKLAVAGAALLVETLDHVEDGSAVAVPQNASLATRAPKLADADARLDWAADPKSILDRIRAFRPEVGAWTLWRDKRLKVWSAEVGEATLDPARLEVGRDSIEVGTEGLSLRLLEVQPEGKRRMSAQEFLRGYRPASGESLR